MLDGWGGGVGPTRSHGTHNYNDIAITGAGDEETSTQWCQE